MQIQQWTCDDEQLLINGCSWMDLYIKLFNSNRLCNTRIPMFGDIYISSNSKEVKSLSRSSSQQLQTVSVSYKLSMTSMLYITPTSYIDYIVWFLLIQTFVAFVLDGIIILKNAGCPTVEWSVIIIFQFLKSWSVYFLLFIIKLIHDETRKSSEVRPSKEEHQKSSKSLVSH